MALDGWIEMPETTLDCSDCVMQGTSACNDCVVSYILDREEGAVIFDAEQERALRSLTAGGLLPDIRYERKTG